MINRRSTPSGDGRGRGRAGGSGRGGRPAFRSDDTRGSFRRDDDTRGGGDRRDSRGGPRPSGDSLRADRGGSRARYGNRDGDTGNRFQRDDRAPARDRGEWTRGGGDSGEARHDRGGSDRGGNRSDERGGNRFDRGSDQRGSDRGFDRGSSRGSERGFDRGSNRGSDRGGARGFDRGSDRGGARGFDRSSDRASDRGSDRGGARYEGGGGRPERSGDRYQSSGRHEGGGFRAERGGDRYQGGRDRFQGSERTGNRPERGGDRGGSRFERPRDDRGGYRPERRDDRGAGGYGAGRRDERQSDDRGVARAGRSGRREDSGSRGTSPTRARFGRRDGDSRTDRTGRSSRRDDVQTIGGTPRRESAGSPQRDRVKAARQPLRDHAFYPEGYTDERDTTEVPDGVRLQKVLAQAGVASRRACEEMIGDGRVTVNGQVVRRFGAKVDPAAQVIHVDGKRIPTAPDLVYYALNKPIGVVSTMDDPQGRPCLADFVEELAPRLFHVGRLDTETEGLLLLTNDGELANRLTHPSYGVQKKYWAKVPGPIPRDLGRRLKQGIELEDGIARADSFAIVQEHGQQALVEVVLHEGRKHVVRRMLEESGHRVIDLARIEFGPVKLGRTKPGTVRALSLKEVGELYAAVKL
ncbi:23S rRNA pseudouridine2605 synthase [Nonomuraea solani]|uniref:Pseudouridine synthase n=1 Tax=Nonomuraea solani TaxID=1144553 RepID=A0A1H6DEE0_9ACTN|nr:pseudouridine synthase [Nonomuraea solani]SEG82926.1 23S rRNA pseudouridine2605 synthase [Nonomuraea solani]